MAEALALVEVELHQLLVADRREEAEPEAGGPLGRGRARPADHDHRMGLLHRSGRDLHRLAVELEGLAGPGLDHGLEAGVEPLAPALPLAAEQLVLDRPVAQAGHDRDAAVADQVEHGDVLGQADRVVQRAPAAPTPRCGMRVVRAATAAPITSGDGR